MLRYILTAASALALVTGAAMAETTVEGTKSVTVTRDVGAPVSGGKTITKRYINHRGMMVTKSKHIREGFAGSSMARTKTVHDPVTGMTRSRTTIER